MANEDVRLGIGIITYNRQEHVQRTVQAVRRHTKTNHQMLIADDGSTDGTSEVLEGLGCKVITGRNMGVCWNKNRALYYLSEISNCNVILLLEDDTFPVEDYWELPWIEATGRYGHVCLAGDWFKDRFTSGEGSPDNPYRSPVISGQCVGYSQKCISDVGFFDTRFKGYGVGHVEHSIRCVRAGYGGDVKRIDSKDRHTFLLISSALKVMDPGGNRTQDQIARNQKIFLGLSGEPNHRDCWRGAEEEQQFHRETSAVDEASLQAKSGLTIEQGPPEFDEEFYLGRYPDVARGVSEGGFRSGLHHYKLFGIKEGRLPCRASDH